MDGVVTEDSDVFLYGAQTVYKDLNTTERVSDRLVDRIALVHSPWIVLEVLGRLNY